MSEQSPPPPIYRPEGVVVVDGEHVSVLNHRPGPAGVSGVELPADRTWQVDHAQPHRLVRLEIRDAEPAGSPLLTAAFGVEAARAMIEHAIEPRDEDDLGRVAARRPEPIEWPPSTRRSRRDAAVDAGDIVLLADLAEDRRLHPLARLAAALQAANALATRCPAEPLEALRPLLVTNAAQLGDAFDDADIALLDDRAAGALFDLCSTSQGIHARSAGRHLGLERVLGRILGLTEPPRSAGIAALDLGAPLPTREPPVSDMVADLALSAAPPGAPESRGLGFQEPLVRRVGDSLVEVTVTRSHDRRWAKVLRHDGFVVLGQAPLRRSGLVDVAEVVVPADVTDEELHVLVVDHTDMSQMADRPLDAIRSAISFGREAARSDRLGHEQVARDRWRNCARLWEHAGDADRAALALALGETAGTRPAHRIYTVDLVTEALVGAT